MEIDEPTTKKIRECGAKETKLSLILVIIVSCLIFPINICEIFLYEKLIEMRGNYVLIEKLRFTFTPNGKREFAPRDQVFPLFFVYRLLLLHKNK